MRIRNLFPFLCGALFLVGCQAFGAPDVAATLQADNDQIIQEATAIARAAQRNRDGIAATAAAAATLTFDIQQVNLVLLATVRAGDPVSQGVVASTDLRAQGLTPGQTWYMKTGVSQFVNESDGCVIAPQIAFEYDTPTIYATLKIYNASAGTQITAQWEYEGSEVYRDSISLGRSASEICVWLSMSQSDLEMQPGSWTVRLFADGAQLESPVAFTIREPDAMMTEGG